MTSMIEPTKLLRTITRAQHSHIVDASPQELFDRLLADLLELTRSEYGFIGDVQEDRDGNPFLKMRAITNIAWSEETLAFYEENAPKGLEFRNPDTLFGAVLRTGEPVLANSPADDPRRGGLPEGHPPLNAFLGAPLYHGRKMVGMVGIANRPGGYDEKLVEEIQPFLITCAGIITSRLARDVEQLAHAQKMQSLGDLTSGITDNFNTLLMGILPNLELIREAVPPTHLGLVDDALVCAQRARQLVRQLMVFAAASSEAARSPHRLEDIVERTLRICRQVFERRVAIETHYEAGVPEVSCDPSDLEQTVMSILLNARDAVSEAEASPLIEIKVFRPPPDALPAGLASSGSSVVALRITDNGPGMTEEVRQQVFEPFFTTKVVGRGTGLGLATSHKVVKEHGGVIECESSPGRGASFTVYLPARSAPARGAGRVLLIDDEEVIHRVVKGILTAAQYEVAIASDGAGALSTLREDRGFDVLLLSRAIPDVDSTSLVAALRELAPTARILYFTGEIVPSVELAKVDGVLQIPIERQDLIDAVARAMAVGPRGGSMPPKI